MHASLRTLHPLTLGLIHVSMHPCTCDLHYRGKPTGIDVQCKTVGFHTVLLPMCQPNHCNGTRAPVLSQRISLHIKQIFLRELHDLLA